VLFHWTSLLRKEHKQTYRTKNQQSWHIDPKKWPLQNFQLFNAFHIFGLKSSKFLSATYQFIQLKYFTYAWTPQLGAEAPLAL